MDLTRNKEDQTRKKVKRTETWKTGLVSAWQQTGQSRRSSSNSVPDRTSPSSSVVTVNSSLASVAVPSPKTEWLLLDAPPLMTFSAFDMAIEMTDSLLYGSSFMVGSLSRLEPLTHIYDSAISFKITYFSPNSSN